MRVAQVCHRYYPFFGGIPTHVEAISERLVRRGSEVEVLTTDSSRQLSREEIRNGVIIKRFSSWAPNSAYHFSLELQNYMRRNSHRYDIVHAHNYHALPALYAAKAKKTTLIFTPHYHGQGHTLFRKMLLIPYKSFLGKHVFQAADRIICVSEYEKGLIIDHFGVDQEKLVVIPNGVNLKEFRNYERWHGSRRVVLYVGRLERYKGVQYLIEALPRLDNNTLLEIVGQGPYEKNLVKLARRLHVEDRAEFHQNLPRKTLLQKYFSSSLLALLSQYEAYSIVIAESLVAGMHCIVANNSSLTEWIDNQNCFGIDYPIKIEVLSQLIRDIVSSETKVDLKKLKGNKIADWEDVVERLEKVYHNSASLE